MAVPLSNGRKAIDAGRFDPPAGGRRRIAYLMSRFPTIAETFILYEIIELERLGLQVEIFPLLRVREKVTHPEAEPLVERAHYSRLWSPALWAAQIYWLRRFPRRYFDAWRLAFAGNWRSPKFFLRALVVVPLAAHFARQIKALGVAHVHAHWATHPALAAYLIRRLTGIPYSFTAHAHDIYVDRAMLGEKISEASFVITISNYNRRLLRELHGEAAAEKIFVIRCGVDPEVFAPPSARRASGAFQLVCVASLRDYKGHPYLVEACSRLKAQGVDFRCLLIGDGEDRPQIEALIRRLGLAEQVLLLGQQPRPRVREIVAAADVMVLASVTTNQGKKEGIPVALMEALAVECPVIATNVSGISELVENGHTGLLVPERDPRALVDAILRLHRDPALGRTLGANGRAKVLREYDLRRNTAVLCGYLSRDWASRGARSPVAAQRAGEQADPGATSLE